MSHNLLRGKPTAAQLYLDGLLDEVLVSRGEVPNLEGRRRVCLPQILFHCLAKYPNNIFMINGATGEKITNAQILKQAIPLARVFEAEGARGKVAAIAMDNDQVTVALYLALLFAGVVPCCLLPTNTVFENSHFLKQIQPSMVFCSEKFHKGIKTAFRSLPELEPNIVLAQTLPGPLDEISSSSLQIPDICLDDAVMLVPTSGSTGLPKACILTQRGSMAKLPSAWYLLEKFPTPTDLALVTAAPSGVIYHRVLTSCVAFSVPMLLPCDCWTQDWIKTALLTYRPTWMQFGSNFAKELVTSITTEHFSSLQCLMLSGGQTSEHTTAMLLNLLPKSSVLENDYGLTETHSVVAAGENGAPLRINNVYEYKLLDNDGNTLGLCASGELYVRGPALAKGYYRSETKLLEDGWFRTGDIFYVDEEERLLFQGRIKFIYKYKHRPVNPEEVEGVISGISGVAACVVCGSEQGGAALVVARGVSRDQVHNAVNDTLNFYKRLHRGVGFVSALPTLPSGKTDRTKCMTLVEQLIAAGECF